MELTDNREHLCVCGGKLRKEGNSPIKVSAPYAPQDEIWSCPLCGKFFMKIWKAGDIDYYTEKADYFAVFDELKHSLRFCVLCNGSRSDSSPLYKAIPVCSKCFISKDWEDRYNRREVDKKFPSDTEMHNFLAGERAIEYRSYDEALVKLQPFAEMGFSLAEFRLGEVFEKGSMELRNFETALEWYKKAACHQFAQAFIRVGKLYAENVSVGVELVEAYKWSNLGACLGDLDNVPLRDKLAEKMTLDELYQAQEDSSLELKRNFSTRDVRRRVFDNLKKVYGELEGSFRYAEMLDGRSCETFILDFRESEKLYRKLADDRYPPAMARLGEKLARGEGVVKNTEEAAEWLTKAIFRNWFPAIEFVWEAVDRYPELKFERSWVEARFFDEIESGNGKAMYVWGMINFKGRGIRTNLEEAHKWLNLAQYFGEKLNHPNPLETIEREISFEQLKKVLDHTVQWLEDHQNRIRSIAKDRRTMRDRVKTEGEAKWFKLGELFQYGKEGGLRHILLSYGCFDLALKAGSNNAISHLEYIKRIITSSKTDLAIELAQNFKKTGEIPYEKMS